MKVSHRELRYALTEHIERDRADHEHLKQILLAHIDSDMPDTDHAAIKALFVSHIENTALEHQRLLTALDDHISEPAHLRRMREMRDKKR